MSQLAIMSRDLDGYFMSPDILVTERVYEADRRYHITPGSYMYGAVLVEMRDRPDGCVISLGVRPSGFSWRPRYAAYRRSISWLWFALSWERRYIQVPGRIVADHLGEQTAAAATIAEGGV